MDSDSNRDERFPDGAFAANNNPNFESEVPPLESLPEKELTLRDWLVGFLGYTKSSVYGIVAILSFYIWPATIYFYTKKWQISAAAVGAEILLFALFLVAISHVRYWIKQR